MNIKQLFRQFDITLMYAISGIALFVGIGILVYTFVPRSFGTSVVSIPDDTSDIEHELPPCDYRRALDGVCVSTKSDSNPKLVAVMVENHFESWPQSGIADARVVYEAPVEGNITRFLLLFTADQEVAKVGPVRSARPYYLDWLAEYGTPLYMHVGGSPDALDRIIAQDVNDLNEFSRGWYYWRDSSRYAPHNAYTASTFWSDAIEQYESSYVYTSYDGWDFGSVASCTSDCVAEIDIVYSGLTYTAGWVYNTSTERYARVQAGEAHIMSDGTQIEADTVIVQFVDTAVLDGVGRLGMKTVGTGEAIVFQKGHALEGVWKKESVTDRTRWYDSNGGKITLNPGQIWVQVINRDAVTYQ